jgi:hypothetical protein
MCCGVSGGHLFQRRYVALQVDEGSLVVWVCVHIDFNSERAGLVSVERLREYRFSSYEYLWKKPPGFGDGGGHC